MSKAQTDISQEGKEKQPKIRFSTSLINQESVHLNFN